MGLQIPTKHKKANAAVSTNIANQEYFPFLLQIPELSESCVVLCLPHQKLKQRWTWDYSEEKSVVRTDEQYISSSI